MGAHTGLLRRWVINVTLGEMAGFMVPAAVWGGLASAGLSDAVVYLPVVVAGAGEGAVLGWAQSRVLRDVLAGFAARDWIRNTALAAGLAWSLGMLPSLLQAAFGEGVPDALLIAIGICGGVMMLISIGWAQSLVLRRHLPRTERWVAINALAWFAGLPFTFAAMTLAPDNAIAREAAAAVGGLGMAGTVALLTGVVLARMLGSMAGSVAGPEADSRADPGAEPGAGQRADLASDSGAGPGVGPGTGPGAGPGACQRADLASDSGADSGADPMADPPRR